MHTVHRTTGRLLTQLAQAEAEKGVMQLQGDRGFDPLRLGEKFTIGEGDQEANGLPWLVEGMTQQYRCRHIMISTLLSHNVKSLELMPSLNPD